MAAQKEAESAAKKMARAMRKAVVVNTVQASVAKYIDKKRLATAMKSAK